MLNSTPHHSLLVAIRIFTLLSKWPAQRLANHAWRRKLARVDVCLHMRPHTVSRGPQAAMTHRILLKNNTTLKARGHLVGVLQRRDWVQRIIDEQNGDFGLERTFKSPLGP